MVIRDPHYPLRPLYGMMTNMEVPGFPATAFNLAAMTNAQITPVLVAFYLSTDGTIAAKRIRLKLYIGLTDM
jgi:hypothetical protein